MMLANTQSEPKGVITIEYIYLLLLGNPQGAIRVIRERNENTRALILIFVSYPLYRGGDRLAHRCEITFMSPSTAGGESRLTKRGYQL
jgi:hypothetical protein